MADQRTKRRQNFQNISWFWDLYKREKLDMDPPYQRRSVWNDAYREQFIDTILLDYPAPAIFLFSKIDHDGRTTYEIVDGKQRLTTVFEFLEGRLSVSEKSELASLRGKTFDALSTGQRISFYEYDFSVEYLPTNNESVINNVFNRLNKNMARLTAQELRHAKFEGVFIQTAEECTEWTESKFERSMPRIAEQSRKQMKDVEFFATLLLFLEEGPKSYSVLDLDKAFSDRDSGWEKRNEVLDEFRSNIDVISNIVGCPEGQSLLRTRLRNQTDFFSLFAAVAELRREELLPNDLSVVAQNLKAFAELLEDDDRRSNQSEAMRYYNAARSASNDQKNRLIRISSMRKAIRGEMQAGD